MPEEVNRLVTDQLADLLFTPSVDGDQNLQAEGVEVGKIHFVGNVMIDSLIRLLPSAIACSKDGLPDQYALVTLHRPSNVDDSVALKSILEVSERIKIKRGHVPRHAQTVLRLHRCLCPESRRPHDRCGFALQGPRNSRVPSSPCAIKIEVLSTPGLIRTNGDLSWRVDIRLGRF